MFVFDFKKYLDKIFRFFVLFFVYFPCSLSCSCSLNAAYLKSSNYDLVKMTDVIVLARTVSFSVGPGMNDNRIYFKIDEVLKGRFDEDKFDDVGMNDFAGRSAEDNFDYPRPGAGFGACNAYDYRIGFEYLLFLNFESGQWHVSGPAFSRINEEVDGTFSPWVEAVRRYIEISSIGNYNIEKDELKKLKKLESVRGSEYSMALVKDIDNHFLTPSPEKSISDLIDMYSEAKSDEIKKGVLWAISKKEDNQGEEVFLFMLDSLKMDFFHDDYNPQALYFERLQDKNSINLLVNAYLGLDSVKNWRTRRIILSTMARLCDERCKILMPQIQKQSSAVEKRDFSKLFDEYEK